MRAAWGTLLLVIAAFRGKPAAWFRRIARHDGELADLLQRFTDGETLDEIAGDNDAL